MGMLVALAAACGGDQGPDVDPKVEPFVGTWDADSLVIRSIADTTKFVNILDFGSFFITVEPSGQYTATIIVYGNASPEIGQLGVLNSTTLTLTPTFPTGRPVATASYEFDGPDHLILDGATEFDINNDGIDESGEAHFELTRQP